MTAKITLQLDGEIPIVVPDDLNQITSYVLQEQGDWFEDEIKFVRKLVKRGQKVIDVGANYGIFTLTLAKSVGIEGRVWAFEPASRTAAFLQESVNASRWTHVTIDLSALSDHEGSAKLSLNQNAELNEIIREEEATGAFETVRLSTLDVSMSHHGWHGIDFIKIDAEGEEEAIIRGGSNFFRQESPLVQYEIKASHGLNLDLTQAFKAIGYDSYRLIPGLNVLTPFEPHGLVDDYLLNLFCCKPDRAKTLANAEQLVLPEDLHDSESAIDLLTRLEALPEHSWQWTLTKLPYGRLLAPHWSRDNPNEASQHVSIALALHAVALDDRYAARDRFHALRIGTGLLTGLCNKQPTPTRLMTLARMARAFGARKIAVIALGSLLEQLRRTQQLDLSEPFLAADSRYESLDPSRSITDWFFACATETLEREASYSSFYLGSASIPRLESALRTGYGSVEISRRLALIKKRLLQ